MNVSAMKQITVIPVKVMFQEEKKVVSEPRPSRGWGSAGGCCRGSVPCRFQRSAFIFRSFGGRLSSGLPPPDSSGLCMGTGAGVSVGAKLCWYRSPVD